MPRRPNPVPTYRLHKPTGQAVATVRTPEGRKDVYLGKYDSPESRTAYRKLLAEHAQQPAPCDPRTGPSVAEVLLAFLRHAELYYRRPDGTQTHEVVEFKLVVRAVRELYAHEPADGFGPKALKAVRAGMVAAGLSRGLINRRVGRIKRIFKWAASDELIPGAVYQNLRTLAGLQAGRTEAPDTEPVRPAPEADVERVSGHVRPEVTAMIRVQRLTGMRPGEVCLIRPCDLDTSGPVWLYRPRYHKLAYRNKPRVIAVGPKAQAVLKRFEPGDPAEHYFSPRRAVEGLRAERAAKRQTPRYPSQAARKQPRKSNPKRVPAEHYTTDAYGRAIARGCEKAGVPVWAPNQLRHTAATEFRKRFGLEAAQVLLGHERADVTQVYAEANVALAASVAAAMG